MFPKSLRRSRLAIALTCTAVVLLLLSQPSIANFSKGQGSLQTVTTRANLKAGAISLLDSDGTAMIIHANLDQQKSGGTAAESGGGRLACGILKAK